MSRVGAALRRTGALMLLVVVQTACTEPSSDDSEDKAGSSTTPTTSSTTTNAINSTLPPTSAIVAPSTANPPADRPPASAPTSVPARATVHLIDSATASRMRWSWREGCPVALDDLRLVKIVHWGFDGAEHDGELVVHGTYGGAMARTFDLLLANRFPIQQVRLVDEFEGDDDRSMEANNTSAFNCRTVAGSSRWSEHAYGRAIDINPIQNPYVTSTGRVDPPAGAAYTNRSDKRPGMITARDATVTALAKIGWSWGGYWSSGKDYQHFSSTGR